MLRYVANDILAGGTTVAAGAGATTVLSDTIGSTAEIAQAGCRIVVEATYTHTNNSTLKLQHGIPLVSGTVDWADIGSRAQLTLSSTAGSPTLYELTLHPGVANDAAQLPLRPLLRVVLVTGASSTASVTRVNALVPEAAHRRAGTTSRSAD